MNMNEYADAKNEARQDAMAESLSAELRLERHLDMLQSSDGMIDQLRRRTDVADTLMTILAWAITSEPGSATRQKCILDMANALHRQARRGV